MDPSYTMALPDCDAMLQSQSRFSRSQLLRQSSTHSSSTSGSSRMGPTRVRKQTSANNSPHNVQRRRTTANHTTRCSPYQTQEQRLRNYYSSRHQIPIARPMSWHPGSEHLHTLATHVPACEPAMGNTIEGLENLAVSGTPTSSVQQSVENALAMGYGFPTATPSTTCDQSSLEIGGYGIAETALGPTYDPYGAYNPPQQPQYQYTLQAPAYNDHAPTTYQMQQWSQLQPYLASHAVQASPNRLPTQPPANKPQELKVTTRPRMARRGSQELVSIGLYDNDDNDFLSALNSAVTSYPSRDGKGLKLEEGWQPPHDDEDDEEDEGYSTDEGDEIDEVPPVHTSAPPEIQTSFYPPTYGDLSNQSFFFNDDDQYASESLHSDYYAINHGYQDAQPKPIDPGTGSFLWF